MTNLIKRSSVGVASHEVTPFGALLAPLSSERDRIEVELSAQIARLKDELTAVEEQHALDLVHAREEGARSALAERSDAEEQALEELRAALVDVGSAWKGRLGAWEGAASGISRAILEKIFTGDDAEARAAQVESCIRRRLALLEAETIVRLRVSAEDFADHGRLAASNAALGSRFELLSDETLPPGGCVIDLKLGHVDIGLGEQWRRISELLDRIEREGLSS